MSSWGWGNTIFQITLCTGVFKYLLPKVVFFLFVFNWIHPFFWKSRNIFCRSKLKKVWFQTCHLYFVFSWIHPLFFISKSAKIGGEHLMWWQFKKKWDSCARERTRSARFWNHTRNYQPVRARSPCNVLSGSSPAAQLVHNEVRRAKFMDGWYGMNGISKVSFNFFILCTYIEHAYMYLRRY